MHCYRMPETLGQATDNPSGPTAPRLGSSPRTDDPTTDHRCATASRLAPSGPLVRRRTAQRRSRHQSSAQPSTRPPTSINSLQSDRQPGAPTSRMSRSLPRTQTATAEDVEPPERRAERHGRRGPNNLLAHWRAAGSQRGCGVRYTHRVGDGEEKQGGGIPAGSLARRSSEHGDLRQDAGRRSGHGHRGPLRQTEQDGEEPLAPTARNWGREQLPGHQHFPDESGVAVTMCTRPQLRTTPTIRMKPVASATRPVRRAGRDIAAAVRGRWCATSLQPSAPPLRDQHPEWPVCRPPAFRSDPPARGAGRRR